jgi:hypothetical protein
VLKNQEIIVTKTDIEINTYVISLDYSQHNHHTEAFASTCLEIRDD